MKKIALLLLGFYFIAVFNKPVVASKPWQEFLKQQKEIRKEVRETVREGKDEGSSPAEIRNRIRETVREIKEENKTLIDQLKEKITGLKFVVRITGEIQSVGSGMLTVKDKDGKSYEVYISDKTVLRRRFWGKADISEFAVGNKVNVIGKWKNEEKTQIDAHLIRNISIQKRYGVFFGSVTSKNSESFIIKTAQRGEQTVVVTSTIKMVNRKQESITYQDLAVGHKVRVKGLWDNTLNKITEVTEIKDFSLPIKEISPSPTTAL